MKHLSLILFSLLFSALSMATNTVIQGSVKEFNGEMLRAANYADFISFKKTHLGDALIENGEFRLEIDIDQTTQVMLFIQDKQTSFFAEAGQVYNLSLSYKEESNTNRAFEKYLDLKFSFPKADELNQRIKQFNTAYQDFFSEHYKEIVVNEAGKELAAFIKEQEENEIYQQNEFLANYVKYALASLRQVNSEPREELSNKYLKGQKVLLNHKEYMNFFSQFYAKDFEQLLITKKGADLMKALMFERDLEKSLQLIMKFKAFDQKELAELYLINGLFEVYYLKTVEPKSSLILLNELATKASSEDLKQMASNVYSQLKQGGENSVAPPFSLTNVDGKNLNLEELKGKPVYLSFWANWSLSSLKELKLIERLNDDFGEQIHFVSINIDENQEIYKEVKQSNAYQWHFLYAGNEYEMRDQYNVKTVPAYFLINARGEFIKQFAPGPQYIRQELKKLSSVGG